MADLKDRHQTSEGHALAVEFVENELHRFHPYFENTVAHYKQFSHNPHESRVEEISSVLRPEHAALSAPLSPPALVHETTGPESAAPGPTPDKNVHKTMTTWNMIFPSAMEEFKGMQDVKAPRHCKPEYDIRSGTTWPDVYGNLEKARHDYTGQTGSKDRVQRVLGWTAGNAIEPVRMATKVVQGIEIVSPVLAAVQIILDAVQKYAEVRKETLDAFDELEDVFSDVELFLEIFPDEKRILDLAVGLVASVLLAVERGISFFTRSGLRRGVGAVLKGQDYANPLLDSLNTIKSRSEKLLAQAVKTHTRNFDRYSRDTSGTLGKITDGISDVKTHTRNFDRYSRDTLRTLDKITDHISGVETTLFLLMDKADEEAEHRRRQNSTIRKQDEKIIHLESCLRSISPAPPHGTGAPVWAHHSPQTETPYINQEDLWGLLDIMDIDTADMEIIEEKGKQLPLRDCVRTEQIVHDHVFQEWIISPTSTKLMIYSNFPGLKVEISALSLFCTTLAKAFRSRERYVCLVWFCGSHLGYDDDLDSDLSDDDPEDDLDDYSIYDQEDDYSPGVKQGVMRRMMRSLIAQLLCDYDFGPRHLLPPGVDPDVIEECRSLAQLRHLFRWLVRLLPEEVTLVYLLDGIVFYEREEFEDPMLDVLGDILELTRSDDVLATSKVLVTSPRPTLTVRVGFENEDVGANGAGVLKGSIMSMDLLIPSHTDVSEERVNRNLGDNI